MAGPNNRFTSASSSGLAGPGAAAAVIRSDPRGVETSVVPYSLETRILPVTCVSGSGSKAISVGAGGATGVFGAARLPPQPAERRSPISPSGSHALPIHLPATVRRLLRLDADRDG